MLPEIAPWPALAAGALFGFAGLAALSQGMARHHMQLWSDPPTEQRRMAWRAGGAALLFAGLSVCVLGWGVGAGLAAWLGMLTPAGLALVFLLAYAARTIRILTIAAPALGLAVTAAALAVTKQYVASG